MSRQPFIVYWHYYTLGHSHSITLGHSIIKGYSPAEAKHIQELRMKKNGWVKPGVDKVLSMVAEQKIMDSRENPVSW